MVPQCYPSSRHDAPWDPALAGFMKRITSRQNPLVATFRAVARGERRGLLLDGPHLVAEALASRVAMTQAMVTPEGLEREDVKALVERLDRSGTEVVSVTAPLMAEIGRAHV